MKTRPTIRTTALAATIAAMATTATLTSAQEDRLYNTHVLPDSLMIEPVGDQAMGLKVDLILRGPDDFYQRKSFDTGELIEFDPGSVTDGTMADGTYHYEVRIMDIQGLQSNRETGEIHSVEPDLQNISGAFSIKNGQIVSPNIQEESADKFAQGVTSKGATTNAQPPSQGTQDQVIADDLIVQRSLCVGFDCINGEVFSFDTIRLKENNLRIKFDDTSSSGSFPNNDWELIANDSANGGANKFSIHDVTGSRTPFTIEAGARSNSLYVESTGDVGFGTSNPVLNGHFVDGDTPAIRLEQDGSSGFTPQIWDIAGNETSFFVRDATNGSTLPFRVFPASPSNTLVVRDGNVGMGTTSPSETLHVQGSDGTTTAKIEETSATQADRTMLTLTNNGGARIIFDDSSADANDWVIATAGNDLLRISKVGSGGTEFELDESGNLTLRGTLTTASNVYPDYVFKEGYTLMPIREVEAFIRKNGHLPNVKSADEIIRDGLDLTEGHVKLMEKVEELTLYTIEQQKLIEELRSRLNGLEDS